MRLQSSDDSDSDDEADKLNVSLKVPEKASASVSRWFSGNKLFEGVEDKEMSSLPVMPKTDKEIRREKRKAAKDRQERRATKKAKKEDDQYEKEFGSEFDIQPLSQMHDSDDENVNLDSDDDEKVSAATKALIRSGMGAALKSDVTVGGAKENNAFEVVKVPEDNELPIMDERVYDSEHEDYDAEDRAQTLGLAHLMVQRSKAKEVVDASYNRYAWNDSSELPDWFCDDEEKHYRPQIPIPKAILDQMRERFMEMATKPVKKVAEARGRKNRQSLKKLKAAKKKATDIANLPDMSTREKLKAIDKAMKGAKVKKQNKVYVVSQRGGKSSTAQSAGKKPSGKVKLVDTRMKKDKRNEKIKSKRGKKPKR